MLKINEVTKTYGSFTAVSNVSLEANKGEIVGIIGANGAGKTTTFRMTLGIVEPTMGSVTWNGEKITHERSAIIGYLPEERGLYPKLKVKDQLIYLARLRGMKKKDAIRAMEYWLEKFEIMPYANKKASELSKGNQQKVQFIYAVLHEPELLILDEPFSGLDPINVEMLKQAILEVKAKGTTILFSTHRMEHVEELCERIAMFKKGKIIEQGYVSEIRRKYGRKNVLIQTDEPVTKEEFNTFDGVEWIEHSPSGDKIKIENEEASQAVLRALTKRTFVRKFEVEEPTLNEIFIQKVGEEHE